jgi:DNA replication protein DnaC
MAKPLEPELEAGLRRLKLRRVRELAPELLQTARTQRWPPEDLLTVLVREEIAARERSNLANRLRAAQFPGHKTLDAFDPAASELSRTRSSSYVRWNGSSATTISCSPARRHRQVPSRRGARPRCLRAGHRVRFFSADDLVEALYRGLADNSVGKLIAGLLRNDVVIIDVLGFTAVDRVAAEDLFRFVTAAYEKRSLIFSTNVEFERWTRFLPDENRRHRDSRPAPSRPGRSRGPPAS